jgi:hypothetical protein
MFETSFYLSILGNKGDDSPNSISKLVESGKYEEFIGKFINGLVHQGHFQTRHNKPVGGKTALRIAGDLLALIEILGGDISSFDLELFYSWVDLDRYKED